MMNITKTSGLNKSVSYQHVLHPAFRFVIDDTNPLVPTQLNRCAVLVRSSQSLPSYLDHHNRGEFI